VRSTPSSPAGKERVHELIDSWGKLVSESRQTSVILSLRGHRKGALWHKLASKLRCTRPELLEKKIITIVSLQKNHNSTEELRAKIEHKVRFAVQ